VKPVLVLGSTGFLGGHLVPELSRLGHDVRTYGRRPGGHRDVREIVGSLDDTEGLARAMEGAAVVVHLAWEGYPTSSVVDPIGHMGANMRFSRAVLEACRLAGVPRLVFASSGGTVYGIPEKVPIPESHPTLPISTHGLSKLIAEKMLAASPHVHTIVMRTANAYGPGQRPGREQGLVATALGRIAAGRPVEIWGDGSAVRDFVHAADVAAAFAQAVEYEGTDRVFNVGSGVGLSVRDVLRALAQVSGREPEVVYTAGQHGDVPVSVLDIGRARNVLRWSPRHAWPESLAPTWDWVRAQPPVA
jgi:UDP-glucose 4-epimerase